MTSLGEIYGPGHTQAEYLPALAAGYETGWWNDNGTPGPWPHDYNDADSSAQPDTSLHHPDPRQNGDEPLSDQEIEGSADTPPQGT